MFDNFDRTKYKKLLSRIRFLRKKYYEYLGHLDTEEILHEVLIRYLEGRNKHQLLEHSVIDVIYKEHGRPRNGINKRFKLLHPLPYSDDIFTMFDDDHLKDYVRIDQYIECLRREEKIIFNLIVQWGLTSREVAKIFSVDEARISVRIKNICEKLEKNVK